MKLSAPVCLSMVLLTVAYSYSQNPQLEITLSDGNVREGFIKVDGGKVWFRIAGTDKKRIPLICVHGGPGAPHDYMEPVEKLSDERPVIFYDQLGCGNSERPADTSLWNIRRFVEEFATVCKALQLNEFHILAQSWGTMLIAEYMQRKPQGVKSIVFGGSAFSATRFAQDCRAYLEELPDTQQQAIQKAEATGNYTSPEYQEAMNTFYSLHVCRLEPMPLCVQHTFEKMGTEVYLHMWGPSEFSVMGTLKQFDIINKLKNITVPVLLACGEFDEATPEATRFYQQNIPNSEMVVFKDASHMHHIEKEDEFLKILRDFLHKNE